MSGRQPGNRQRLAVLIAVVHFGTLLLAGLVEPLASNLGAVLGAEALVVSVLGAAIGADTVRPGGSTAMAWGTSAPRVADQTREAP